MKMKMLFALTVLGCLAAWAADKVQPLDIKLGLWEVTETHNTTGMPPIPAGMLDKMTPEQRARFEAAMKARGTEGPQTKTRKECITKEKLDKDLAFADERKECTHTVVDSSSSNLEVKIHCENQGMKSDGQFRVQATSSESVKGSVEMAVAGSGNTMNMNMTFSGRYLGSSCGDTK